MVVGHEDVRLNSVGSRFRPAIVQCAHVIAEHPQAGAAVEDEARAARRGQLDARRVSAVAPRIAVERRR
jgi:hypothetical protein